MKRYKLDYNRNTDAKLFDSFIEKCRKEGKLLYADGTRFYFCEREAGAAFGDFTNGDKKGLIAYMIELEKSQYERYLRRTMN
ncbi:MAG TPA: hypothetical protein VHC46_09590 [Thermodesulfobacteriota bacterium]|nr:hypothetical protein [Thermodesulfobacteriota bacterium]